MQLHQLDHNFADNVHSGVNPNIFLGARPPPQKFFLFLDLKMAICGAFLVQFLQFS